MVKVESWYGQLEWNRWCEWLEYSRGQLEWGRGVELEQSFCVDSKSEAFVVIVRVKFWSGQLQWSLGVDSQSGVLVWIVRMESWCV